MANTEDMPGRMITMGGECVYETTGNVEEEIMNWSSPLLLHEDRMFVDDISLMAGEG